MDINRIMSDIQDAKLFFKEVEECGFSLDQPSIAFSKGQEIYKR